MNRILFVDDTAPILDGLKRMLRSQRREWDMKFVISGKEALSLMDAEPFDVVVTDMKMPGMNGAELLTQVQTRFPRTVRIVLSGHADSDVSMQSASVAHQFLSKPSDAQTIKSVVERACSLESLLPEPSLQEAAGFLRELPVRPQTYNALKDALADENADTQTIGAIVAQDIGITVKILQLVNSSFFRAPKTITDAQEATTCLGLTTLRGLVQSFKMFRPIEGCSELSGFSLEREHTHSLLTARIARRLLNDKSDSDMAFLTGKLHDTGKFVLATCLTKPFQGVLQAGAGGDRPFHVLEREILGVSHAEIGAYLLGLWGLPEPIVDAVAYHHHPSFAPEQTTFGVLGATHVADALAREQDRWSPESIELDEPYLQALGVAGKIPEWRAIAEEEAGAIASESS